MCQYGLESPFDPATLFFVLVEELEERRFIVVAAVVNGAMNMTAISMTPEFDSRNLLSCNSE